MKKQIAVTFALAASMIALGGLSGCASCSRTVKSVSSDVAGGLDRTVTLYDYNGEEIKSWSGKFDISEDDNEIYFDDANGKRVILQGGIVVCEEN